MNIFKKNWFIILLISFFVFTPVFLHAQGNVNLTEYECNDTIDNDGDNLIDYPADTGCLTEKDDSEIIISGQIENPIKADTLYGLIKLILEGVLKIGIPIVALAIIYCGFLFVSARGNPESIKKAKDALIYTLIGAAILLGSWAIAQLISDTVLQF